MPATVNLARLLPAMAKILNSHFGPLPLVTLLAVLLLAPSSLVRAQQSEPRISTEEEIKADFASVPCKNEERLRATRILFEKMGAAASDISIDKHKDVDNLMIRIQGSTKETIIVGAHYDQTGGGCGAIDNGRVSSPSLTCLEV